MSASQSSSRNYTTNITQDQRVAIGGNGTAISIPGSLKVGGNLTLTDGGAVNAALNTVNNAVASTVGAVQQLAQGSNQIAAQVADSQRAFVETASGQKTFLWGAAILAAVALYSRK